MQKIEEYIREEERLISKVAAVSNTTHTCCCGIVAYGLCIVLCIVPVEVLKFLLLGVHWLYTNQLVLLKALSLEYIVMLHQIRRNSRNLFGNILTLNNRRAPCYARFFLERIKKFSLKKINKNRTQKEFLNLSYFWAWFFWLIMNSLIAKSKSNSDLQQNGTFSILI